MASNPDVTVIRTENCLVTFGQEDTWANGGDGVTPDSRFGIHETANAADPELAWYPFFGVSSGRDRQTILRGRWTLTGGVPDIKIQSGGDLGKLLALGIGRLDGSTVKEGRSDTDGRCNSMTMQIAARDTDGNYPFIRNYIGGKINRMNLAASEGEELKLSIDEIIFKDIRTNFGKSVKNTGVSLGNDPGLTTDGRFLFAGADLEFFGTKLSRLKSVSLVLDNQMEAKYYLAKSRGDPVNLTQVTNDIVEGKRKWSCDVDLDLVSADTDFELLDFVLTQAAESGAPTLGGKIHWDFALTPGEGSGSLVIDCSLNTSSPNVGTVVQTGKANVGAPPAGYMASNYTLDIDSVQIQLPG